MLPLLSKEERDLFLQEVKSIYHAIAAYLKTNLPLNNQLLRDLHVLDSSLHSDPTGADTIVRIGRWIPGLLSTYEIDLLNDEWLWYALENIDDSWIIKRQYCDLDGKECLEYQKIDFYWNNVLPILRTNGQPKYPTMGKLIKSECLLEPDIDDGTVSPNRLIFWYFVASNVSRISWNFEPDWIKLRDAAVTWITSWPVVHFWTVFRRFNFFSIHLCRYQPLFLFELSTNQSRLCMQRFGSLSAMPAPQTALDEATFIVTCYLQFSARQRSIFPKFSPVIELDETYRRHYLLFLSTLKKFENLIRSQFLHLIDWLGRYFTICYETKYSLATILPDSIRAWNSTLVSVFTNGFLYIRLKDTVVYFEKPHGQAFFK